MAHEPRQLWFESPLVLSLAGTLAIHLILGVFGDALVVFNPPQPDPPPPPHVELVEVEPPPIVKPPPPPVKEPEPPVKAPEPPPLPAVRTHEPVHHAEPPPPAQPPPPSDPTPSTGGAPVVAMPDVAPGATGVPVAVGHRTEHVGRGGSGTGTGAGSGAGSGDSPPPVSVATIKTRALPKGDYAYQEAKDYPAEAKQLGIEGKIRVKLIVDATGAVTSAKLLNSLGHGLDELALRRANLIVFEPARDTDDKPVASVVVWTFDLNLPK